MSAKIIDGKEISANLKNNLKLEIEDLINKGYREPALAVILVGDDPASKVYVSNKEKACNYIGIKTISYRLPENTQITELYKLIDDLNNDNNVDGILVQFPLPKHLDQSLIIQKIDPSKDVDGFHPYNMGRLASRIPALRPCTPKGIMHMIKSVQSDLKGVDALVIGASNIVGRPMALELLLEGASVSVVHKFTKNLKSYVEKAELIVVAVGKANFLDGSWIKENAIVIDVGINRLPDGKLVGDVQFESASQKASYITPVPGGVGPMTVASLMENTVIAYKNHINI